MAWKIFVIAPRRRAFAAALLYALSLTVRFTSTAGEETVAQTMQGNPMTSIMLNDGARMLRNSAPKPALPTAFNRAWLGPKTCRKACESPTPVPATPDCPP